MGVLCRRLDAAQQELNAIRSASEAAAPTLWKHAVNECNEAHVTLDRLGAPKTRRVLQRNGVGEQDVMIGLAERIRRLPR
jgi:predicted dienelactone hydrolase